MINNINHLHYKFDIIALTHECHLKKIVILSAKWHDTNAFYRKGDDLFYFIIIINNVYDNNYKTKHRINIVKLYIII